MGSGNSPRSLSPITGIWRPVPPVACRWLPVSRRCAESAWTFAIRFGPAAEPALGVTTAGVSGETSQPVVRPPAGALPPDPVGTHLRSVSPNHFRKVGIEAFRPRSLALRHGSCLLPLKLPFSSQPDDAVFDASRHSDLIAAPRSSPCLAPSNRIAHSVTIHSVFTSRVRRRNDLAAVVFVHDRRTVDPHPGSQ
jgi:hypothetical protein